MSLNTMRLLCRTACRPRGQSSRQAAHGLTDCVTHGTAQDPVISSASSAQWPHKRVRRGRKMHLRMQLNGGSVRAIAAHKHAIETPVMVRVRCEAGFVKRRTVVDDQQVARLILMSVAKLRL